MESRGRADLSAVPFQHGLALGFALHRGETESLVAEGQYIAGALAADTEPLVQSAQQSLAAGRKAIESDKPGEARAELLRAYFLAAAAANRGNFQVAATAAQALADLDTLHAKLLDSWKQSVPVLGKKVDLVLRDVSVEEALEAIEKPAGLRIELIPGSVEDAGKMLAGRRVKVTYLDLRGATAAEALDWLLQPLRLNWVVKTGDAADAILVGSDRRLPRVSAWVYDVRAIALPTPQEQGKVEDHQKAIAQAKASSDQFVDAIRKALDVSETDAAWFAPGRLLLIGSPKVHEKALTILTQLRDPNAEPGGVLAALHKVTSRRAEDRREEIRKLDSLDALLATAAVHDEYSWQLLAAALVGELDLEALTELKIVWKAGETEELLEGDGAPIVLRSAWTVAVAARLLPDRKELAALAESARKGCRAAAVKAVASLKGKPHDASAILAAAYGAMAADEADLKGQVLASLGDEPATLVFAVSSLLGWPTEIDREQLAAMVASGSTVGEDAVVLTAMACRRAGDDAWSAFRAEMPELLGSQPLPGSVVVLANRLSGKLP